MNLAFKRIQKESLKAYKNNEVPIGAVVTFNGKVISSARNRKEENYFAFDHAEVIAIKKAGKKLKTWNLEGCYLFVNMEPCSMCKEVIKSARVSKVFYLISSNSEVIDKTEYRKIDSSITDLELEKIKKFFKKMRKKS